VEIARAQKKGALKHHTAKNRGNRERGDGKTIMEVRIATVKGKKEGKSSKNSPVCVVPGYKKKKQRKK